jgi:quinol-cytochrome oxidoreductase complex cytochrome b subunit
MKFPMDKISGTDKRKKTPFGLIFHLHPLKVRRSTLRFTLTFGLGGMAALLVVVQVITGLLLKFHYEPSPEEAYNSILNLQQSLLFGRLLRNIHHWSAITLLWIVFLHMLRVFFTGAYHKPRHVTWIIGLALLLLVILSNFTGYLLPWDQLSYWAVTVSTSMLSYVPFAGDFIRQALLGGKEVSQATLTNFYNLHTGVIPLLIVLLMVYHFWRIRKAGGVITSEKDKESPMADSRTELVNREAAAAIALLALLFLLSSLFDAPLRERANPSISPNPAKAPWYFMGMQELLIHFHPFFAIVVFPLTVFFAACRLPYVSADETSRGLWFLSDRGIRSAKVALADGLLFTILFIGLSELLPDPEVIISSVPSLITKGLVPFAIMIVTLYFFLKYLKRRFSLNRPEIIQSVIILMIVSYSVLTLSGIFFRGEGMNLMWPWRI